MNLFKRETTAEFSSDMNSVVCYHKVNPKGYLYLDDNDKPQIGNYPDEFTDLKNAQNASKEFDKDLNHWDFQTMGPRYFAKETPSEKLSRLREEFKDMSAYFERGLWDGRHRPKNKDFDISKELHGRKLDAWKAGFKVQRELMKMEKAGQFSTLTTEYCRELGIGFATKYHLNERDLEEYKKEGWQINLVIGSQFDNAEWFNNFLTKNKFHSLATGPAITALKKDKDFNAKINKANVDFLKAVNESKFPIKYVKNPKKPISGNYCWMPDGFYINFIPETPKKELVRLLKTLAKYFKPNIWEKEEYGDYSGQLTFGLSDVELVNVNTKGKVINGSEEYEYQEVEELNKKSLTKSELQKKFDCTILSGPHFDKEGYCYCIDDHDHRVTMLRQIDIENAGFKHDPKGK